jgi:hypothetical protein
MKTLSIIASVLLFSAAAAHGQTVIGGNNTITRPASSKNEVVMHDVTGFSNPYTGPGKTKESIERAPNMHPDLSPKVGGVVADSVKYGSVMISPFAPQSYGMGEKYLSAPSPGVDVPHESAYAAHRDAGGLKLFSIEF